MAGDAITLGDTGVLRPGRWRSARALGWMLLLFAVAAVLAFGPAVLAQHAAGWSRDAVFAVLDLSAVLLYPLYALAVRRGERRRADEIAPAPAVREIGVGLLIGLGMFALVFAALRLLGVYTLARGQWVDWPQDLALNLGTGLREELIARLIVFRLLSRAAGVPAGLVASAAIFGALHLGNPHATLVAAAAIAVEAGLMLAAFYLLTGRIWMSVGVHAAWNLAQGSIFGARVSGGTETGSLFTSGPVPGAPDWLSGGGFGPEASLPAMAVGLAVFALVMVRAAGQRRYSPAR